MAIPAVLKKNPPQSGPTRTLFDWGLTALVAIAVAFALQAYVVKPYLIPTDSMANTLVPRQRVLVDRLIYHFRPVRRGDIIVFRCAALGNAVLVKRVVGLPGDLLALHGGQLYSTACKPATPSSTGSTASWNRPSPPLSSLTDIRARPGRLPSPIACLPATTS